MTDNELVELFKPLMISGLISLDYADVIVEQNYQPTQQGVESGATVYFFKTGDHRHGFLGRSDVYNNDEESPAFIHTETQWYETTFQVSALVVQDPANISYTASDLVNSVSSIMQSDTVVNALNAAGVGILRIQDVTNSYFTDDRDRYEADPSFDFTLTYTRDIITSVPIVTKPIRYRIQSI